MEVAPSADADTTSLTVTEVTTSGEGGTGAVALVAHGAGSSARFVAEAFAGPLTTAGYRLVTYDLRGHAASGPARATVDHHLDVHAADLIAVAASIDAEVAVVGGVSLGAHTAARAVASGKVAPQIALACLPAWLGHAPAGVGPHAAIAAEIAHHGVDGMLVRIRSDATLPAWLRDTLLTDYSRHDPASLTAALTALDGGEAPDAAELGRLTVPLAVVGWPDDPGHPLEVAQAWAAHVEPARLVVVEFGEMATGVAALGRAAVEALVGVASSGA